MALAGYRDAGRLIGARGTGAWGYPVQRAPSYSASYSSNVVNAWIAGKVGGIVSAGYCNGLAAGERYGGMTISRCDGRVCEGVCKVDDISLSETIYRRLVSTIESDVDGIVIGAT